MGNLNDFCLFLQEVLIDHLTQTFEDSEMKKEDEDEEATEADQLQQLIHTFCQVLILKKSK